MTLETLVDYARRHSPFYGSRLKGYRFDPASFPCLPLLRREELEAVRRQSEDAYSTRRCRQRRPWVSLRLEGEPALYLALDRKDLRGYAAALGHAWSLLGLGRDDRVAIFDYGTSPIAYLASSLFIPYLTRRRGAGDGGGCISICNDGLPEMSRRAVEILRYVRPKVLFIRGDCLPPFLRSLEEAGVKAGNYGQAVVVAANSEVLAEGQRKESSRQLGVPVYRLLRLDEAAFLAGECPTCSCLHLPPEAYWVEIVDETTSAPLPQGKPGRLVVTNLFATTCPTIRYLAPVRCSLEGPGCPDHPRDMRLRLC